MVFKINDVDITPYILEGNLQWKRNDIDEEEGSGRAIDGTMQRKRIAIKDEWTVPCIPLTGPQAATILSLIEPEFVKVTYTNPVTNTLKTVQMYSNNVPATHFVTDSDGVDKWMGITFPLVEK